MKGITTKGNDLIKPITYNSVGLDENKYAPYEGEDNSGYYRQDFLGYLEGFYESLPNGDRFGNYL